VIKSLDLNTATRWGLNLLALLGTIVALHLAESIVIPTIIALFLTAMLWPAARWMSRRLRFSWAFACLVAVAGLVVINILVTLGLFLAVPKLLQDLPDLRSEEGQAQMYHKFREQVGTIAPLDNEYLPEKPENSRVFQYVKDTLASSYLTDALVKTAVYANLWFWEWVLIMFLVIFMLVEGPMLSRRIVDVFGPSRNAKNKAVLALSDMAHHVRAYLVWRTVINFGMGVLVGLIYHYVFGLKQAWTWAVLTGVLFYVPYLGPLAAGVFPVIEAFFTHTPLSALAVVVIYTVLITVEGYLLVPVVMGHSLELNATTVMLACLFWDLVWGLPGLFLAMPLMAAIKAVCTNVPEWHAWANLMSTDRAALTLPKTVMDISLPALEESQIMRIDDLKAGAKPAQPTERPK
jgi:predicted PurR-regulated permease PerM